MPGGAGTHARGISAERGRRSGWTAGKTFPPDSGGPDFDHCPYTPKLLLVALLWQSYLAGRGREPVSHKTLGGKRKSCWGLELEGKPRVGTA